MMVPCHNNVSCACLEKSGVRKHIRLSFDLSESTVYDAGLTLNHVRVLMFNVQCLLGCADIIHL